MQGGAEDREAEAGDEEDSDCLDDVGVEDAGDTDSHIAHAEKLQSELIRPDAFRFMALTMMNMLAHLMIMLVIL